MNGFRRFASPALLMAPDPPGGGDPPNPAPASPQPTPPAPSPPPTPTQPTPGGSRAEERIAALAAEKAEAERKAADFEDRLKKIEQANESEAETAKREKDEALAAKEAAEAKANRLEREGWASVAAQEAGFRRAEDAILRLDLTKLDTEAKVKAEVKKLAEREDLKDLLGQSSAPTGFGVLGGSGNGRTNEEGVPLDENGEPDHKLGLGAEVLKTLSGLRR